MTDTILETTGLTREFRGFVAVDDVALRGAARDNPRADRPERRRQDDLLQSADEIPATDPRHHSLQGSRHHRPEARRGRAPRPGPQLPDLGRVRASDRARERPPGIAARPRRQLRFLALGGSADGVRRPRARPAGRCRPVGLCRCPGVQLVLRPQARAGDRHHARARTGNAAAGRAHRRHGAWRRRPHRRADPPHPRSAAPS